VSRVWDMADAEQRAEGIADAIAAVERGEVVVMPTDTVYGIGCDAFQPAAVDALLAAKGRGRDMPVPVLVGSWHGMHGLMDVVPTVVRDLVQAFWPGGLTIVVRHSAGLAWDLGDAAGTVAVRMPLHPVALEVIQGVGPMGVSSANRSGMAAASTAQAARDQLGASVSVYLDGGSSGEPISSTIVDCSRPGQPPVMLRGGAVTAAQIREVVPSLQVS
jgi:L-threonylcarbamoyladenylate synthase